MPPSPSTAASYTLVFLSISNPTYYLLLLLPPSRLPLTTSILSPTPPTLPILAPSRLPLTTIGLPPHHFRTILSSAHGLHSLTPPPPPSPSPGTCPSASAHSSYHHPTPSASLPASKDPHTNINNKYRKSST
ncbi:hypothetical protein Pmani_034928 [Petrolisthes manimaculis]|uniref:Uncharacterized protein n=1 Tax=Petrolisthes manimaculis TaxID=1843537 RepID=A0AAE1TR30_9EUCA|nr:hypothetical protein Pmani_034928 [Petrolisthes manimaculis]